VPKMTASKRWTRRETLVALHLLLKVPFGEVHQRNSEIISGAGRLGRTLAAVKMKVFNLHSCLPNKVRGQRLGLPGSSQMDKDVIHDFLSDPAKILDEMRTALLYYGVGTKIDPVAANDEEPAETEGKSLRTHRLLQSLFREKLLSAYGSKCCITDLSQTDLLVASHIKPWREADHAERIVSTNGLLLNALHDKAFDRGLITITDHFEVVLSPGLDGALPKPIVENFFKAYESRKISTPRNDKDYPSPLFLKWHRENVFQKSC